MPRYTHIVFPLLLGWLSATATLSSAQSPALAAVGGPAKDAATSGGPSDTTAQAAESPGGQVSPEDPLKRNASSGKAEADIAKTSSNLKVSYNSTLIYPGMRVGTETLIKRVELSKTGKSGNTKLVFKDRFFTTNLSFYHHPTFHTNFYATGGYTFRRTRNNGFFTEFCPELGYSRTFLGGTTYEVDNSGGVSIKRFAGYNYALASVGMGAGYDFSKMHAQPVAVFYKLNIITMFPYNSTLYVRPTMELGVIYKPKNFLPFSTKIRTKSKAKNS